MNITKHAYVRTSERIGADKRRTKDMARAALTNGITYKMTKDPLRSYLAGLHRGRPKSVKIKLYRGFIYVFRHKKLLTVYEVPEDMR